MDRSRRPHHTPQRTPGVMEAAILGVREAHPTWSGYKIKANLKRKGWEGLPAHSTITEILRRYGKIDPEESLKHRPQQRFEMEQPNQLWQMDFKGHFAINAGRCHPLTVLDDHSRFLLGLRACPDETHQTVTEQLSAIFRQYGLPERMLMDNGSPWSDGRSHPHTAFGAWLMRLGVEVSHGRPFHPQTQGKDERLHGPCMTSCSNNSPWKPWLIASSTSISGESSITTNAPTRRSVWLYLLIATGPACDLSQNSCHPFCTIRQRLSAKWIALAGFPSQVVPSG